MDLYGILNSVAGFVHTHAAAISVASAIVILAMLVGDALDLALFIAQNGWKKAASINVIVGILAADPANSTAAGAAGLAFLGALGAGQTLKSAAVVAIVAIGTVNAGYLVGVDRQKFAELAGLISKPKAAAA